MDNTQHRIEELAHESIAIVPYDARWPELYVEIEAKLARSLPVDLVRRIAHIGSTAVPGLSAKPIIDVQVEVVDLGRVRGEVVPIMNDLRYEFIWRPSIGEHSPFYAWFIRRDEKGQRSQHIHMVEPDQASTDRVLFRDYLRRHPAEADRYEALKRGLAERYQHDRASYTSNKTDHILGIMEKAREWSLHHDP